MGEHRDVVEGSECGVTATGESSASEATSTNTASRAAADAMAEGKDPSWGRT
jgi:hypothetical protein